MVRVNNESFKEESNWVYVDENFFTVLIFLLIKEGSTSTVIAVQNQIVLSEKTALKYFGKAVPVGETLLIPASEECEQEQLYGILLA